MFALAVWLHSMTSMFPGDVYRIDSCPAKLLFNKEEADILLHRPVEPRDLLWAKVSMLVQVLLWLAAALNAVGLWIGAATTDGGWQFAAIHAISTLLE